MQCFRKYFETKYKTHLLNAGKYFCALLVPIISNFFHNDPDIFPLFLSISALAGLYAYCWDVYVDWGLCRKGILRRKLLYPRSWYYVAILLDLALRFAWLLSLYPA